MKSFRPQALVVLSFCLILTVLASGSAILMSQCTIQSSGTIVDDTYLLHIEGSKVKNGLNEVVVLKGINKAGFLDSSDGFWSKGSDDWYTQYGRWDETVVRANLQNMKNWGINVMRITININWWLTNFQGAANNGTSNIPYRTAICRTIELAREYDIYIALAPWSVKSGQATLPFPPYSGSDASVIANQNEWVNFWLNVSRTTRNYSNFLMDLHNEPVGVTSALQVWFNAAEQCINALRADGDNRITIVQWGYCAGFDYDNWLSVWYSQNRTLNNVLFSDHIYRYHGSFQGGQYAATNITFIRDQLGNRSLYYQAMNLSAPIWIGEIGAWGAYTEDQGVTDPSIQAAELDYFRNTLAVLKDWGIGYAVWEWFPEWGSEPGRAWGVISKDWKMTTPISPAIPGKVGQIIYNDING